MRLRKILSALLLSVLVIGLIMLISSRKADKSTWESSLINTGLSDHSQPNLDNDVSNIVQTEVTPTPVPTTAPTVYRPDIDIASWEYILVNNENSIGTYAPSVVAIGNTAQYFDSRALDALESFLQAATDAGFTPYINTAYRPYSAQEYIFNGKASQISWGGTYTYAEAVEIAKTVVAYPGTSEHQTGLACDITDKYYSLMDASQMDQELLAWLQANCADFGFILRYPSDKESITGWNEPWHYRYVGVEAAQFMTENNLCLEELWKLYK